MQIVNRMLREFMNIILNEIGSITFPNTLSFWPVTPLMNEKFDLSNLSLTKLVLDKNELLTHEIYQSICFHTSNWNSNCIFLESLSKIYMSTLMICKLIWFGLLLFVLWSWHTFSSFSTLIFWGQQLSTVRWLITHG